jgi:hypothetical protein
MSKAPRPSRRPKPSDEAGKARKALTIEGYNRAAVRGEGIETAHPKTDTRASQGLAYRPIAMRDFQGDRQDRDDEGVA